MKVSASDSYFEEEWRIASPEERLKINSRHLEAYVDGAVDEILKSRVSPGIAISIVRSDGPIFQKGYGWSNVPDKLAANAETHSYHIGSVSKLFTATVVMQLVEEGLVDLDAEIGTYLPLSAYDDRLGTVTVADLMGHTAGFEERYANFTGKVPNADKLSDEQLLAKYKPTQVRAPGGMASYTNHTWVLLGKVVEAVTGKRYEDYVEAHVLRPLAMVHSGFEPEDAEEEKQFARIKSHKWDGEKFNAIELGVQPQHPLLYPTGGMRASAGDMGRFARMFLNGGELDGAQILNPETFTQSVAHTSKQALETNGRTLIFWTYYIGKHRVYDHTGSSSGFVSRMIVVPSLDIGIFITENSSHGSAINLPKEVVKHLLQEDALAISPRSPQALDTSRYVGTYKLSRGSSRLEKVFLTKYRKVSVTDDNQISIGKKGKERYYYPVDVDLFQSAETGEFLRFFGPPNAKAEVFSKGHSYISFAERVGFLETRTFPTLLLSFGVVASVVFLLWRVIRMVFKALGRTLGDGGGTSLLLTVTSIVNLVAVAAVAIGFSIFGSSLELQFGLFPTPTLGFGFVMAHISVVLAFVSAIMVMLSWLRGHGKVLERVFYTLTASAFVLASLAAIQWNIVPDSLFGIGM
ncbi:MAG: serine hydrolase domain-containing protein [Pseudomonadota bacterium]